MIDHLTAYFYEIGQLKYVKRSGWWMVGIKDPESVAEHTFRAAIIGYVLAHLEGADPEKTAMLCLFHDVHEARILDLHRTAKRYLTNEQGEQQAQIEQTQRLPSSLASAILAFQNGYDEKTSPEACLAHDADLLECLMQAREYQMQGYVHAREWIENCQRGLKTKTAKQIAESCLQVGSDSWWQGLNLLPSTDQEQSHGTDTLAGKPD